MDALRLYSRILAKATDLGASLVGIANVGDLKNAPSFTVSPKMPPYNGVGVYKEGMDTHGNGEVEWPEGAKSVIVIGYAHPKGKPELDFWYGNTSPMGNRKLIGIAKGLIQWLQKEYGISPFHLPYHIERGGIYLKDAAVYAGMGCIGKNNLLVTPRYGPRIRLRGLTIDVDLPSTGPIAFDACAYCDERCNRACPQNSFKEKLYTTEKFEREELPGREGDYDRILCNVQMKIDEENAKEEDVEGIKERVRVLKYCRVCEFSCPVGKNS